MAGDAACDTAACGALGPTRRNQAIHRTWHGDLYVGATSIRGSVKSSELNLVLIVLLLAALESAGLCRVVA